MAFNVGDGDWINSGRLAALSAESPVLMPRPQFSIRTLLWLTLVVAAFMAGFCSSKNASGVNGRNSRTEQSRRTGRGVLSLQSHQMRDPQGRRGGR